MHTSILGIWLCILFLVCACSSNNLPNEIGPNEIGSADTTTTEEEHLETPASNVKEPFHPLFTYLPRNGATEVSINPTIAVTFQMDLADQSITTDTIILRSAEDSTMVTGMTAYDSPTRTIIFQPSEPLRCDTNYTASLAASITDISGKHPLRQNMTWSFTTTAKSLECSHTAFIAFGDWGYGYDTPHQHNVADAMATHCQKTDCHFVVTLGDNFYPTGVTDVNDPQWKEKYRDVYGGLDLPFHPALGWHDHFGNVQAQIDYSQIDSSWNMPATYYAFTSPQDHSGRLVEFFVLDSGDLAYQEEELAWLDEALTQSNAFWKILVTYVPMMSNGAHGDDTLNIAETLAEHICGKIDLVISGHDHIFSHLTDTIKGCDFTQLIIGTGGAASQSFQADPRVIFSDSLYGFGWFDVNAQHIVFQMIDTAGATYYETTLTKP